MTVVDIQLLGQLVGEEAREVDVADAVEVEVVLVLYVYVFKEVAVEVYGFGTCLARERGIVERDDGAVAVTQRVQ